MNGNDANYRSHLGTGWSFPVRPKDGRLTYARREQDVEEAIEIILGTARKERVMLPSFGAGLRSFVFSTNTPATHRAIENEVQRALRDFEPRIRVERVEASSEPSQINLIRVQIDYVVRRTNVFYNMVYPFYLKEGA